MEGGRLIEGGAYEVFLYDSRSFWSRGLENGLVVPGKFTASTKIPSAAIGQKLKENLPHIKELCKYMEMQTTMSDVTEKKLFSYMYSDASADGA